MKTATALTTLLAASVLSAGAVGTAVAASGDAVMTLGSTTQLVAGAQSPIDAGGVKAVRRGKAIPAGYVLVGRKLTIEPGGGAAGAIVRLTCPAGKTLRTYGVTGTAGGSAARGDYVGKRRGEILAFGRPGQTSSATYYGVCR